MTDNDSESSPGVVESTLVISYTSEPKGSRDISEVSI